MPSFQQSDLDSILAEFDSQNDRSVAITAGSFVEYALQTAMEITWRMPSKIVCDRIFKGYGPLATFSAKIEVGFAMGLYDTGARGDLNRIRKIRNTFAHEVVPMSFTSAEISKLCGES